MLAICHRILKTSLTNGGSNDQSQNVCFFVLFFFWQNMVGWLVVLGLAAL